LKKHRVVTVLGVFALLLACSQAAVRTEPLTVNFPTETRGSDALPADFGPDFDAEIDALVLSAVERIPEFGQPAAISLGHPMPSAWAPGPALREAAPVVPGVSALSAIILDEASMEVLYEKNGFARRGPASTTKIITAILAAEYGDLEDTVVSDVDARDMPGSSVMGLRKGDEFSLQDMLYGLMLPSGNDAALAIGRHLAGNDRAFAEQMTQLSRRLGLTGSNFTNAHGLSHPDHYTTAYDMAVMARYLMTFPVLREVVASTSYTAKGSRTISMRTGNALLFNYNGADGVKTGFTYRSGKTYVGSAVRDGHRIYVVLMNSPNRESDAKALLDWAFNSYDWGVTANVGALGIGPRTGSATSAFCQAGKPGATDCAPRPR
jgi:serine-type D-Ala-D-Ala carboxypeptidase (penicillin-binding protein 5/6)